MKKILKRQAYTVPYFNMLGFTFSLGSVPLLKL